MSETAVPTQTLDVRGAACPIPVVKTAKAMKTMSSGEVLELLATDPGVEPDMHAWAKQTGNELLSITQEDGVFRVLLRKAQMSDNGDPSVLYVMTHGTASPERCATPFFLAASAAAMDVDVSIYFTMNGPQLLAKGVAERIGPKGEQGQKLQYFIDQALDCGVKLLVCQPSLDLNDLTQDDLIEGVRMIGGAAFNDMAMDADAVITF